MEEVVTKVRYTYQLLSYIRSRCNKRGSTVVASRQLAANVARFLQREKPCESMEEGDRNSSGHFDLNKTVQADDFGKPSK